MQKDNPLVSICIPTYTQLEHLELTLKSIEAQTFQDYEIIITDDTPDDSVFNLIESIELKSKITYYKNINQLGSPANWNESIRKSKGAYIKILHHDDKFTSPDSLQNFVNALEKNKKYSFVFSASFGFNPSSRAHVTNRPSSFEMRRFVKNPFLLIFKNKIGAPSTVIFRREINTLFDENIKWLVDVDFYIQCIKKLGHVLYLNEILVETAIGEDHQVTASCVDNPMLLAKEYLYLINKYPLEVKQNRSQITNFWFMFFSRYGFDFKIDVNLVSPEEARTFNHFRLMYSNSFARKFIFIVFEKFRKLLRKIRRY